MQMYTIAAIVPRKKIVQPVNAFTWCLLVRNSHQPAKLRFIYDGLCLAYGTINSFGEKLSTILSERSLHHAVNAAPAWTRS